MCNSRSKKNIEKQLLAQIQSCTKVIKHNMINQDAFVLAQADQQEVDLNKYREQIKKELEGEYTRYSRGNLIVKDH